MNTTTREDVHLEEFQCQDHVGLIDAVALAAAFPGLPDLSIGMVELFVTIEYHEEPGERTSRDYPGIPPHLVPDAVCVRSIVSADGETSIDREHNTPGFLLLDRIVFAYLEKHG